MAKNEYNQDAQVGILRVQVAQILDFSIFKRVFQHQWSTLGPGRGVTKAGTQVECKAIGD